jgi:hypothetical protein
MKLEGCVSDFIQKQCSTIGEFKAADMKSKSTGKCSPFMPEKLALKKAWGNRRAIHLDQTPASPRAEFVNRPRDDFLAGPGFTANQDGGGRGCYRVDLSEDGVQAAEASNDRLEERWSCAFWLAQDWFIWTIKSRTHSGDSGASANESLPVRPTSQSLFGARLPLNARSLAESPP